MVQKLTPPCFVHVNIQLVRLPSVEIFNKFLFKTLSTSFALLKTPIKKRFCCLFEKVILEATVDALSVVSHLDRVVLIILFVLCNKYYKLWN